MPNPSRIDISTLTAFDVHVHLEHAGELSATDAQATQYFKGMASRDPDALAEYYRSRKMACVVFTVEEKLTGRPHLLQHRRWPTSPPSTPTSRWRSRA